MPYTSADLANLDAAFASGTKTIRASDNRMVEMQSIRDYMVLRNIMLDEISAANAGPNPVRQVQVFTTSGFE